MADHLLTDLHGLTVAVLDHVEHGVDDEKMSLETVHTVSLASKVTK